jgi:hypothetical protein
MIINGCLFEPDDAGLLDEVEEGAEEGADPGIRIVSANQVSI